MEQIPSFNALIQKSVIDNWDRDALTDFKGQTLQFHDVARKIEKLHILFENSGIQKGDKIALCGRNSSQWAVAFIATLTYGAIAVPILHEFNAEQIHNIVNHSESRLLFVILHMLLTEVLGELLAIEFVQMFAGIGQLVGTTDHQRIIGIVDDTFQCGHRLRIDDRCHMIAHE